MPGGGAAAERLLARYGTAESTLLDNPALAPAREDRALAVAKVLEGEWGGFVAPEM